MDLQVRYQSRRKCLQFRSYRLQRQDLLVRLRQCVCGLYGHGRNTDFRGQSTGKANKDGEVEGIDRALLSIHCCNTVGAAGTSNTTSYIESGAGIKEGGKTGLTAVTASGLFLLCRTR